MTIYLFVLENEVTNIILCFSGETPTLYQVLPEKKVDKVTGMMGSTHVYDVPTSIPVGPLGSAKRPDGGMVELTLDPSELDLVDTDAMAARYEQQIRQQQSNIQKEDLSDVVAEHISRQKVVFLVSIIHYFICFDSLMTV